jgi:hypothetical protein
MTALPGALAEAAKLRLRQGKAPHATNDKRRININLASILPNPFASIKFTLP